MAKLRELIIKISANSSSFQSEIARASRMGADYYKVMEKGGRQASAASRDSQQALRDLNSQLVSVKDTAKGLAGAFAGLFATGRLISMADNYNSLNARIKLATTSTEDFTQAQQGLLRISQYTGSTFESNASLFTRVASALREYGYSTQDILSLTDALATGLQVSGASAEETSSLIVQLSQALGRGVLRGQDFNSVAQSGQRIMKALSDGLGVAQKDLKGLA
ncbi:tape measure protein, partial [Xenorhabdus hominickii]